MTPQQQRIAIAKACPNLFRVMKESNDLCWIPPGSIYEEDVDPLNDLNAMHEVEKVLEVEDAPELLSNYHASLIHVMDCKTTSWRRIHATAAQRAEAWLRTRNLWTD